MPERFRDDDSYHQMILSFSQGNQAGLAELYDHYAPALLGIINQILDDHELACECLQHSFNEIWNKKASFDGGKERIFTWMYRIARSSALNFLNNGHDSFNPRHQPISPDESAQARREVIYPEEEKSEVSPDNSSEPGKVLHLVYMQGFTVAEAAKRLNISIETAKFQLIFAIRQVKGKVTT